MIVNRGKVFVYLICIVFFPLFIYSQDLSPDSAEGKSIKEKQEIGQEEANDKPTKVLHAEPLYIDLIRDLGARKGEKEWNLGYGLLDRGNYEEYEFLIEYEFALVNRLGLEIELPFSFYSSGDGTSNVPFNTLEGLQLAAQYTFLVSKKARASLAIGYLHKFKFISFKEYGQQPLYKGNLFNPFLVAAKRWGGNFHTLVYSGPEIDRSFNTGSSNVSFEINTSLHYMIPDSNNFIGVELNKSIEEGNFGMTMRPQMRVQIKEDILVGLVSGIPVEQKDEKFSMFFRLIYEPDK